MREVESNLNSPTASDRLAIKREKFRAIVACALPGYRPPRVSVADVMTPRPLCITADTTLLAVVRMFHEQQFRHLLVTDGAGRLCGVISDRDVIRRFPPGEAPDEASLEGILAADIMAADVVSLSSGQPVAEALAIMLDFGIHCLPVLDQDVLVGIVTSTDLYALLQAMLQPSAASVREQPAQLAACGR